MKRFILLSTQRTGSTFLRILLNNHSRINCHGEVFLSNSMSLDSFRHYCIERSFAAKTQHYLHNNRLARGLGLNITSKGLISEYLQSLFYSKEHCGPWSDIAERGQFINKPEAEIAGFKLMHGTLEQHPNLLSWILEQPDLHIIHHLRRNLLKSYISKLRMSQTRVAHITDHDQKHAPVTVNKKEMLGYFTLMEKQSSHYREMLENRFPYLETSYETLFKEQGAMIDQLTEFLSVDRENIQLPDIKKISTSKLDREVANPEALIDALSGTPYADFLDDFEIN